MPCHPFSRCAIAILLALLLFVSPASSTVILLLVTPDVVVIGTDSRRVMTSNRNTQRPSTAQIDSDEKVVSIAQGQVIIAATGVTGFRPHNGREAYNFPTWARALDIKPETPIKQVANEVAVKSFGIMKEYLSEDIRKGAYTEEGIPYNDGSPSPIVRYFIGKCDPGGCSAVTVEIWVDWKKRVINQPEIELQFPKSGPGSISSLCCVEHDRERRDRQCFPKRLPRAAILLASLSERDGCGSAGSNFAT